MSKKVKLLFDGFVKLEQHTVEGLPYPIIVLRASDSVAGLLYDRTRNRVLLVNQRRVPMEREDNPDDRITELVAGRFDVKLGPKALLVKEAREEAGVTITEDDVQLLNGGRPLALSAGILTERCYLALAEIKPEMVADGDENLGLAEEGENITRIWVDADEFIASTHECVQVMALALYLQGYRARIQAEERRLEGEGLNLLI